MKTIKKIFTVLFYFFLILIFYNMADLYLFHKKQDFTNFEHSVFPSKGNASEDIRKEIFSALHISEDGKPLSEPGKIDSFLEKHYSKEDILMLGTSSEEVIIGFNKAKQFKHGDINFLKNVKFDGFVKSRCDFQLAQYIVLYINHNVNILCHLLILLTFYEFVKFDTKNAYVSIHGNAAWLSTIGYFQTMIKGLILPLRHNAILIKHGDVWKIHKSQTDWFYDTNFLLNKIVFSVILSFICLIILIIRLVLYTISWKIKRIKEN